MKAHLGLTTLLFMTLTTLAQADYVDLSPGESHTLTTQYGSTTVTCAGASETRVINPVRCGDALLAKFRACKQTRSERTCFEETFSYRSEECLSADFSNACYEACNSTDIAQSVCYSTCYR